MRANDPLFGDLWEVVTGVSTAIQLYRHVVRVLAVHVLSCIWDGLDIAGGPVLRPFTDADAFAAHPN